MEAATPYINLVLLVMVLGVSIVKWIGAGGLRIAVEDAQQSLDELRADVYEDLRADMAAAIAEGADAVIAKLPKTRSKPPIPAATASEETTAGAMAGGGAV